MRGADHGTGKTKTTAMPSAGVGRPSILTRDMGTLTLIHRRLSICVLLLLALIVLPAGSSVDAAAGGPTQMLASSTPQSGVVRAIMFWMEGCGHCHKVMTEVLPPLQQQYGDRLDIKLIEISDPQAADLLDRAAAAMGFKPGEYGVPFLIIGDHVLMGSLQIPAELPGLIETYVARGGVDYPNIPGLEKLAQQSAPTGQATANGFALAWAVMAILISALLYAVIGGLWAFGRGRILPGRSDRIAWLVPLLSVAGLLISFYLSYVETTATKAVCGPVGDCNAVQASPYARLFGVLPVGVLGVVGYVAIVVIWVWGRLRDDIVAIYAPLSVLAMTLFGVVFSIYLTYLELKVIHAICIWCLASAVIMAALLVLSTGPALESVSESA